MDIPTEEDDDPEEMEVSVPPDHPASLEQCDHLNCSNETERQRICSRCDPIMRAESPNVCSHCETSITD